MEGYRRVERGNISPFSFRKQICQWNIPTPLWFPRNSLRELHGQNMFTWTTLCLQRIILTQKKTRRRKNSLRLNHSVFWTASARKSRWNMTANQRTANYKPEVLFLDQSEKKPESGFWTYKCIMPSFPVSKYREGGYDRRLLMGGGRLRKLRP